MFPWFIESFQMAIKRNRIHNSFPPHAADWNVIHEKVNSRFPGYNLTATRRGEQKIFIWLSNVNGNSLLESYGYAHRDGEKRPNTHYFAIVGDTQTLQQVLESFQPVSTRLSTFVKECFGWENKREITPKDHTCAQPDLMYHPLKIYACNELLLSPHPGKVISVPVV